MTDSNTVEAVAQDLWGALVRQCASTRPELHHEVKVLVQVKESDIAAAITALQSLGWQSPSDVKAACVAAQRRAVDHAIAVLDAHSEYDSNLCCDGRECGCHGSSVHDSIKHHIRALSPSPGPWQRVPEGFAVVPIEPTQEMENAGRHEISMTIDAAPHFGNVANAAYRAMISEVKNADAQ